MLHVIIRKCLVEYMYPFIPILLFLSHTYTDLRLCGNRIICVTWWWCNSCCSGQSQQCGFLWKTAALSRFPCSTLCSLLSWQERRENVLFSEKKAVPPGLSCGCNTLERNHFCLLFTLQCPTHFLWPVAGMYCRMTKWCYQHPRQLYYTRNICSWACLWVTITKTHHTRANVLLQWGQRSRWSDSCREAQNLYLLS